MFHSFTRNVAQRPLDPRISYRKEHRPIAAHKHILFNILLRRRLFHRQTLHAHPRVTVGRTIRTIILTRTLIFRVFYRLPVALPIPKHVWPGRHVISAAIKKRKQQSKFIPAPTPTFSAVSPTVPPRRRHMRRIESKPRHIRLVREVRPNSTLASKLSRSSTRTSVIPRGPAQRARAPRHNLSARRSRNRQMTSRRTCHMPSNGSPRSPHRTAMHSPARTSAHPATMRSTARVALCRQTVGISN